MEQKSTRFRWDKLNLKNFFVFENINSEWILEFFFFAEVKRTRIFLKIVHNKKKCITFGSILKSNTYAIINN